jgi:hypothetical protein
MWASIDTDNNVTKVYTKPTAITYGDVNYPQNVMSSWSNDELATIKVYPVIQDNTNFEDPYYYNNTNPTYTFYASVTVQGTNYTNVVVQAYGTATAKPLNDSTDSEGFLTPGLKPQQISIAQNSAYSTLQPSDWYVVRKSDNGTAIPTDWDNWRQSVRTTCETYITNVNNCTNVTQLEALGKAPTYPASPDESS